MPYRDRMSRKKSPPKRADADEYPRGIRGRNAALDRIGLKNPPSIRFDRRENPACSVSDTSVFGIEQKADIDMKKMWGVSTLTLRRATALMPLAALAASIERAEA